MYKNPCPALPDMDYFKQFPSPMFQAMYDQHIGSINTTTTYIGPFLYWLTRILDAHQVVEIGMAQGWSSFFMASGAHDNAVRGGSESMYYGVDIADLQYIFDLMDERGVPAKFLHKNSLDLIKEDFGGKPLNLVFIDGWHNTTHILRELEILRPLIKDAGMGYYVMHDVYATCEKAFKAVRNKYPQDEFIRFIHGYGLGIFRVMDNYDHNKTFWPDGEQTPDFPIAPGLPLTPENIRKVSI
jgi:hypothetical protein